MQEKAKQTLDPYCRVRKVRIPEGSQVKFEGLLADKSTIKEAISLEAALDGQSYQNAEVQRTKTGVPVTLRLISSKR